MNYFVFLRPETDNPDKGLTMTYKYRVTLSGIKGFYRVYKVNASNTLYSFHKQMRADMEFPADQLILFKELDADGAVIGRVGLFDLGFGAADQVTLGKTVKDGVASFVYFYDVTNKKSVNITFEGEIPEETSMPEIIDTKGPDPIDFENGYVAFEDLPDEQRHLPGDPEKRKKNPLADLLGIDLDKDLGDEDEDLDDEDIDDDEDDDDDDRDDDAVEIYDGSEELTL